MADTSGPSPWIVDVLQLNLDDLDVSQLPALSCSAAQAATLQGNLNVTSAATVGTTLTVTQLLTAKGGLSVTSGTLTVSGDVSVGGSLILNRKDIFLGGPSDKFHGIGLHSEFAKQVVDGPIVYGNTGGALGTMSDGQKIALSWTSDGTTNVQGALAVGDAKNPTLLVNSTNVTVQQSVPVKMGALTCTSINSPIWKVRQVLANPGPLPVEGKFPSSGGTLVVFFSGSGRRGNVASMTLTLSIDGKDARSVTRWTNETDSHKTFPSLVEVFSGYGTGDHTLKIETKDATTDSNDYFYATVMELPF